MNVYPVLIGSSSVKVGVSIVYVVGLSTIASSTFLYNILYSIISLNGVAITSLSGILNTTWLFTVVFEAPDHSNHTICHHRNLYHV